MPNTLELLGWETDIDILNLPYNKEYKPFVGCLSHTSKWEIVLYYLYKTNNILTDGIIVMAPQYHKMLGKFADKIDCIPSLAIE